MASLHTVAKSAAGVPMVAQGSGDSVSTSGNQNTVGGMLQRALPPHALRMNFRLGDKLRDKR
uniref:Uncharacterized protein n=1 Tax=Oryza nivara TaxID=4536 RepID=A0A0E0ILT1_ORYNI